MRKRDCYQRDGSIIHNLVQIVRYYHKYTNIGFDILVILVPLNVCVTLKR